jgi:NO-binding membrane sensor protein with MHYT domain
MTVSHEPWLVALSVIVAIQGAYVGLSLVLRLNDADVRLRKRLLVGGALSLAVAIWSMHFVGMLAIRESERIAFLVVPTVVSFFVCVFVVGLAIYIASTNPKSHSILTLAGTLMGVGIVTMHFIGMLALHGNMSIEHDPRFVVAAVVIGILASNLAIRLAFASTPPPLAMASIALGLAISGMHYTAMAGTTLSGSTVDPAAAMLSRDVLAVVVSLTAFLISGFFFLALLPEPAYARANGEEEDTLPKPMFQSAPQMAKSAAEAQAATQGDAFGNVAGNSAARASVGALPVLKEGATIYLPVGRVVAVRADAHYSTVFDGADSYFCGLSISDIETRLDPQNFMRVHRSYIVSIRNVASIKRSGDGGVAKLAGNVPYSLPISRRKLSELKARLER